MKRSYSPHALKTAAWSLAILTTLTMSNVAVAQTGEDALRFTQRIPGLNAVSVGVAGTGVAGVADPSAMILNPAGLGYATHSSVSGSFSSFDVSDEAFFRSGGSVFPTESDLTSSGVGHLAGLYKFPTSRGSLVIAASFTQVTSYERDLFFDGENGLNSITDFFMPLPGEFELNQDGDGIFPEFFRTPSFIAYETFAIDFDQGLYDANDPVPFLPAVSAGTVAQYGSVTEEGRMSELNFGAAFEAAEGVMLGMSVNVPFSRYTYSRQLEEEDIFDENDGSNGTTDFDYLSYFESFQSDLIGINARFGLSARVSPQVRLGITLETPTYFTIEDEYDTILRTEFDNGDVFQYGDRIDEDAGAGRFEYDLITPWHLGIGGSFRTGSLTLMGDLEYVDWSQMEFHHDNYSFATENADIAQQLEGVMNTRLGATYETGDITIRGGIALYPDPRRPRFNNVTEQAEIDRKRAFFSLGFGYQFSNDLRLDAAWMQERFDDSYLPYTEVANAPVVNEEVTRNRFQVGISYRMR